MAVVFVSDYVAVKADSRVMATDSCSCVRCSLNIAERLVQTFAKILIFLVGVGIDGNIGRGPYTKPKLRVLL